MKQTHSDADKNKGGRRMKRGMGEFCKCPEVKTILLINTSYHLNFKINAMLETLNFSDLGQISSFNTLGFSFFQLGQPEFFNYFFPYFTHEKKKKVFTPFCSALRFCANCINELCRNWDFHPKQLKYYSIKPNH